MILFNKVLLSLLFFILPLLIGHQVNAIGNIVFFDNFNNSYLNRNNWESYTNGGNIIVSNGFLSLSSSANNNFPYIKSKIDPFPPNQDYLLESRIQFPNITAWGVGFLAGSSAPNNQIPYNDPISSRIFTYHADTSQPTFWYRFLEQNIFSPLAPRDNNFHKIGVEYKNGIYKYLFDGKEIFQTNSTEKLHSIFFGSPYNQKVLNENTPWSSMTLDYIRISTLSTPTPTPTPQPSAKKVVVIPGFGASWNADALFNCKADEYEGPWVLHPLEKSMYPSLYTALTNAGYTPVPFYYDWRKELGSHNTELSSLIASKMNATDRFDIVGHSFGGLVGRAYISANGANNRVNRYISLGSPHKGLPLAYLAWGGGEIWNADFNYWVYMTTMVRLCQFKNRLNPQDAVQTFVPSINNLLPTYPYIRSETGTTLKPISEMKTLNNWLPTHPFPPFEGTIVGTLSGNGLQTLSSIVVTNRTKYNLLNDEWRDGRAIGKEYSNEGDGSVLLQSSQLEGADNRVIYGDHSAIVASASAQQQIISFLSGTPQSLSPNGENIPISISNNTSALLVLSYPARMSLIDTDGKTITDTDGMIAIKEPKAGNYTILVTPKTIGVTQIAVAQFYNNGTSFWNEYTHLSQDTKSMKIYINPNSPSADIDR